MDIFGIGGPEFFMLLALGSIVLGPRRIVLIYREASKIIKQIQGLSRGLTKELNHEIERLNHEIKYGEPQPAEEGQVEDPSKNGSSRELPQAYQQFREDFPDEGALDLPQKPSPEDGP